MLQIKSRLRRFFRSDSGLYLGLTQHKAKSSKIRNTNWNGNVGLEGRESGRDWKAPISISMSRPWPSVAVSILALPSLSRRTTSNVRVRASIVPCAGVNCLHCPCVTQQLSDIFTYAYGGSFKLPLNVDRSTIQQPPAHTHIRSAVGIRA